MKSRHAGETFAENVNLKLYFDFASKGSVVLASTR